MTTKKYFYLSFDGFAVSAVAGFELVWLGNELVNELVWLGNDSTRAYLRQ